MSRRRQGTRKNLRWLKFRPEAIEMEPRLLLSVYVVNDPSDQGLNTGMGPAETSDGTITLRSAIQQVNIDGGGTIDFGSTMTITTTGLPAITAPRVTIDGGTLGSVIVQGQSKGPSGLVLDGGAALIEHLELIDFGADGIEIHSAGNVVKQDMISGNSQHGIAISQATATDNLIEGNFIGTNADGTKAMGNAWFGIAIYGQAQNNTIGGTVADARNVISGNLEKGIYIGGAGTTGNVVLGNYIGTTAAGDQALGNAWYGVEVDAAGNTIGGSVAGAGNVIAANPVYGILLDPTDGDATLVQGNLIGLNAAGTAALGNGTGVLVAGSGNTIGGTVAAARNVISGSGGSGIVIGGPAATANLVIGNEIGTNAAGTAALANGDDGVGLDAAVDNTIGGGAFGARNIISGNASSGVYLFNGASRNKVQGNYIGVDATGETPLGNGFDGVSIEGASDNIIGTDGNGINDAAEGNVISTNYNYGISLFGANTDGTVIAGNRIGTDAAGTKALGETSVGIWIGGGVTHTRVGTNADGISDTAERNIISGNKSMGIDIQGTTTTGTLIAGNFIGTDASGTYGLGNGSWGILIEQGSTDNTIGGAIADARNVISGTGSFGAGIEASGNLIEGNYIGTNAAGTAAIANSDGIDIEATGNTIGGSVSGAGNLVSGNTYSGVYLGQTGNSTLIEGNEIGTNAAGAAAIPNGWDGIRVYGAGNTIGGLTSTPGTGAGNLISGNSQNGILVSGGAASNLIAGNIIGLDAEGSSPLPNGYQGVDLFSAGAGNSIGGIDAGARNVISGNYGGNGGILLAGVSDTLVAGNFIGTDISGSVALGNAFYGIDVVGSSNNTIGGSSIGSGNVISGNGQVDLRIETANNFYGLYASASGNLVQGNFIGTNPDGTAALPGGHTGIDLFAGGNTIGGASAGAGNVLSGHSSEGIYIDSTAGSELIQGNRIGTNAAGTAALANGFVGIQVSGQNNTIGGTVPGAGNVVSGNTQYGVWIVGDAASGNLLEGNLVGTTGNGTAGLGNGDVGVYIANGASSNTVGGTEAAALNILSGNGNWGVLIFGSGANGNLVEGNHIGTNADGSAALGNKYGVGLYTAGNTVGGSITGTGNLISGNSSRGIYIHTTAEFNLIQGNRVGTNADGTTALGNGYDGIQVSGPNNTIGGTATGTGNVVSGNGHDGIRITAAVSGNLIEGNRVGTNAEGTDAISNASYGIDIHGTSNTVGGSGSGAGNVISGNKLDGIYLASDGGSDLIQGNSIGTNAAGTAALANGGDGIGLYAASNTIGGTAPGAGNIIAFNDGNGVTVGNSTTDAAFGDTILGNSIYANAALGIDLGDDGVTPNDSAGHTGPNLFQDFPVITSANTIGSTTTIAGTVTGPSNSIIRIELFSNSVADPSGYGQGHVFLGDVMVTTGVGGLGTFTFTTSSAVPAGQVVSATATDPGGNTSEFSRDVSVTANAPLDVGYALLSGPLYNPIRHNYTETVELTNNGPSAINGFWFVLDGLTPGVTLINAAGTTVDGSPYLVIGPLTPGQSVTLTLTFTKTSSSLFINYTPEFFPIG